MVATQEKARGRLPDPVAQLTIYIPAEVRRQLKILAASRGVPMSQMINEWLAEKLKEANG
jgi:hypothetical protein